MQVISGFLSSGTVDVLGRMILCCGAVLWIVQCSATSLASTTLDRDNQKCFQTLLNSFWGAGGGTNLLLVETPAFLRAQWL